MESVGKFRSTKIKNAAVFGASGGIGSALVDALLAAGCECVYAGSRTPIAPSAGLRPFAFDLQDEQSIADAAERMREEPLDLVLVATGVLTLENGIGPERTIKRIQSDAMAETFMLNTIGPALIAKHVLPILPRSRRNIFAALSARVGSITDNRLGGWHSYRASKAALNMLIKNMALEMARTHPKTIVAGLHPGTVDTELSKPFQSRLADSQLTSPDAAATNLLNVIDALEPSHSGKIFDWKGEEIPA